jgi:Na+-translocating ferredoxin:NAD+ oxidoreductase RNF subunit RnfB
MHEHGSITSVLQASGPLLQAAVIFLAFLGIIFGMALAFIAKIFFVKSDPALDEITEALAHAHCGACGFAGCEQYAEAVLHDANVPPNLCTPGGQQCTETVAQLTGKVAQAREPLYARIMCQGGKSNSTRKFDYNGVKDCRASVIAGGGDKTCPYGCLEYGTCVQVCPFGALSMGQNNLPIVDIGKCTGCRKCEAACPKKVIEVLPASGTVLVACHSKDKGAVTRKYCEAGCIGCGKCVKTCPVTAITLESNLARIDISKCTKCLQCVSVCPTKAIVNLIPL